MFYCHSTAFTADCGSLGSSYMLSYLITLYTDMNDSGSYWGDNDLHEL